MEKGLVVVVAVSLFRIINKNHPDPKISKKYNV